MTRKTIMLVEDDQDQVVLAMRALRKHGIVEEVDEVVVMRDGEEALGYLFAEDSQAGWDRTVILEFILLDVKLPKVDGLQVLERLRDDEREVLGGHALPRLVLTQLQRDTVARAARSKLRCTLCLCVAGYLPLFRYASNSGHGRQFMTLSFSTHARRACETPNLVKLRALSSWASVSIVMRTPAFTASRR